MKSTFTFLVFIFLFFSENSTAQIYINEWIASNSSVTTDPDFDESGDWIELFNDYNDSLDVSGFYLSDNLTNPTKWRFPANTKIPPNDFILVWADGEDTGLHTNFKLAKDGEEIGLYNQDTLLLDSVIYSFQKTDISMGRRSDGASSLGFFTQPTPGASNSSPSYEGITFYQPHFSVKGGFFESPIEVSMSTIDGKIRYTLDGSFPDQNAPEYTDPIEISASTVLRARIFVNNFIPGKTLTHTYFFEDTFEERGLPVVSISTNPEYFWDDDIGLYVQDFKPEWEYPINIELFENDGSNRAAFNELAGTKVNGLNSWELPQKMLGIYFDNEYDNNNLEYPLFFDRPRNQYDNFTLRASGSDWSSTLFRDALCQGLTTETMDLEKMAYRPAIAFVNGEYMGIHNLRSRIDESFIEDNFGYAGSTYDLIENDGEVEEGDDIAFNELFALFEEDLMEPANFQAVEEVMDIQNFTDYFITQIWTSNSSWGHNIQMWKPKAAGTKWRWILQDFDRGFSGSTNNLIDYFTTDNNPGGYSWARRPLEKMLENQTFAQQFASRFADHLYTTFHPQRVTKIIQEYKERIQNEVPYHVGRWAGTTSSYGDGIESVEFWEDEVQELISYAEDRQTFVINDLQDHFQLEDAVNLGVMNFPAEGGVVNINGIKIPEPTWNGQYFKNMPFELEAKAGVGYEFEGWSKSTANYETLIEKEQEWKYLDDGSDQGTAWRNQSFNDGSWLVGYAELGYGDGDENTTLSYGLDPNDKYPTTYFRKSFTIQNLADYTGLLQINLKRDDGAIVYLNGIELFRTNMPSGNVAYDDYALNFVGGAAEDAFISYIIQSENLLEGDNLIAVEIHQSDNNSSDISFDLELNALKLDQLDIFSTADLLTVNLSSDTFLIAHFLPVENCLLPREITQNTTLTIDCSPYLAPGDVLIKENITLTVEPGVEIHFPEEAHLFIQGGLEVEGTENAPVLFKAIQGADRWGNLSFQSPTDTSRIVWLEILDATKGVHPIYENAAISGFHAVLEIEHLKIEQVHGNPILTYYSDISLKNSQLHSKITGDLINVKYGKGFIENCDFKGNAQPDTDAIDYDEVENGVIRNSKIYDFFGFNSDGIDLGEESSDVIIENNFIQNCTDKGISVGQFTTIFAQNNTLINCDQGIAVKDLSTAEIDQNTFYNVATPIACFEKNVGEGGGMAFVSNSILSNSPEAPYLEDPFSSVIFSNSLSDTESIPGTDNLFVNPYFSAPSFYDFTLKSNSSAINAGLDDFGNIIDLGTKFHDFSAPPTVMISAIHYHPELEADAEFVQIFNPGNETIDLTGYVVSNAIDFTFPATQLDPKDTLWLVKNLSFFLDVDAQIYEWTSGKLSNGGETIRLTDSYGIVIDQVTYDDEFPWAIEADGLGAWLSLISEELDNHFAESWEPLGLVDTKEIISESFDIHVFPNPTDDYLKIQSPSVLIEDVEIFNLLGQSAFQRTYSPSYEVLLNLNSLKSGIWLIKVNGKGIEEKIIIN